MTKPIAQDATQNLTPVFSFFSEDKTDKRGYITTIIMRSYYYNIVLFILPPSTKEKGGALRAFFSAKSLKLRGLFLATCKQIHSGWVALRILRVGVCWLNA